MTAIGDLRHRLALEQPLPTGDGAGGAAISWVAVASLWAKLETLHGEERFLFGRVDAALTHRVILRYRDGVAPDMRFSLGARVLDIHAVFDPDGAGRWLHCLCAERVA